MVKKQSTSTNAGIAARDYRKKLGLRQSDFWSQLGVSQPVASRYEAGRAVPKPVRLLLELAYGETKDSRKLFSKLRTHTRTAERLGALDENQSADTASDSL